VGRLLIGSLPLSVLTRSEIALKETLLNIALAVAILVGSYVIMHFFARAMYVRCFACGTLNARRRAVCRQCGDQLKK
jgi:rRNA maturation endonuclease Nob1